MELPRGAKLSSSSGSTRRDGGGAGAGGAGGGGDAGAKAPASAQQRLVAVIQRARSSPCVRGFVLSLALSALIVLALHLVVVSTASVRWLVQGTGKSSGGSSDGDDGNPVTALESRIIEMQVSIDGLRRQLDGRHQLLTRIGEERYMVQALSDRLKVAQNQWTKESIVGYFQQAYNEDDGGDRLLLPRLDALLSEIFVARDGGREADFDRIRRADTVHLRQLFFEARRELHRLYHDDDHHHQDEPQHHHQHRRRGGLNWTQINSLLSFGEEGDPSTVLDWRERMRPDCSAREEAILRLREQRREREADGSLSSSNSIQATAMLDELVDGHGEIQRRVDWIAGELVADRLNDLERMWKVALETTFEQVQLQAERLVADSRARVFLAMKDLHAQLDRLEARRLVQGRDMDLAVHEENQMQHQQQQDGSLRCAQPTQVLDWINVALDAHYRKRSMRDALAEAIAHDDRTRINATAIIAELYAMTLPPGVGVQDNADPHHHRLHLPRLVGSPFPSLGLRPHEPGMRLRLESTPLVSRQLALWIDSVLEKMEGRIDTVDSWVDSLQARATMMRKQQQQHGTSAYENRLSYLRQEEASIGRYLVRSLLELVGRVDDARRVGLAPRGKEHEEGR